MDGGIWYPHRHTRHREGYRGSPVKQSCIILGTIILRAKGLEIITGDIVAIGIFTAWCRIPGIMTFRRTIE